jgi:hypothetical protein
MAMISRNLLVLRGVSVLVDGVAVSVRLDSYQANCQNPASPFISRHPSPVCQQTEVERITNPSYSEPGQRRFHPDLTGVDTAANGAGRPGSVGRIANPSHGVGVSSRGPAITAGTVRGPGSTAATAFGRFTADVMASAGKVIYGRLMAASAWPMLTGGRLCLPGKQQASKGTQAGTAWFRPLDGTRTASTRG